MTSLDYGLYMPYEVQLEHHAATSTTHMTVLGPQRSPGQPATRHLLTPGVYMVSLAYNGAAEATLQHVGGGTTNTVTVPTGTAGTPRTSAPMKISVQGTTEYLQVSAPSTGGTARATISVIPAATFDEMAESAQGVSVLSEISNLKSIKADKSTLDARVPSDLSLRVDTTVGTRIFSGNTMIYGSTGRRTIITNSIPALSGAGNVYITRDGDFVTMEMSIYRMDTTSGGKILFNIPTGFRPAASLYSNIFANRDPISVFTLDIMGNGDVQEVGTPLAGRHYGVFSWITKNSWPATLPGLPA